MLKAKFSRLHPSSGLLKWRMSQRKLHLNIKKRKKATKGDNVTKRVNVHGSLVVCPCLRDVKIC